MLETLSSFPKCDQGCSGHAAALPWEAAEERKEAGSPKPQPPDL